MENIIVEGKQPNKDISFQWINDNEDINVIEQGIPLIFFDKLQQKRQKEMEYRLLRRITETQYHNQELIDFNPSLNKMNRYNNIIPYNHSRVELPVEQQEEEQIGSYINASWIQFSSEQDIKPQFIATQGPSVDSINNFWKMIWYKKISSIIMLCQLKEGDKNQCEQYWPNEEQEEKKYQNTDVKCIKIEIIKEKIIKRTFSVKNNANSQANGGQLQEQQSQESSFNNENEVNELNAEKEQNYHIVHQYQFMAWPDHQVPEPQHFDKVQYIVDIMQQCQIEQKGCVVHCSAGIGRTGTLLGLVNIELALNYYKPKFIEGYKDYKQKKNLFNQEDNSVFQQIEESNYTKVYEKQPDFIQEIGEKYGKISIFGTTRRLREQRWGMVHTNEQYDYLYKYTCKKLESFIQEIEDSQNENQMQQEQ